MTAPIVLIGIPVLLALVVALSGSIGRRGDAWAAANLLAGGPDRSVPS
jgi:hypothetical protein